MLDYIVRRSWTRSTPCYECLALFPANVCQWHDVSYLLSSLLNIFISTNMVVQNTRRKEND